MVHFTNLDPQVNSTRPQLNAAQFYSKNNTGIKKNILQVNTNLYNTDPWHAKRKKLNKEITAHSLMQHKVAEIIYPSLW